MFAVALVLLIAVVMLAVGLQVAMFTKDRPIYGVMGLVLLAGPGALLAILTAAF
ncbi:MAG TPA: hypothetical protein VNO31_46245 [Umezawaea sp.]|nr:hypothetical protein [Umezawaea sp.]